LIVICKKVGVDGKQNKKHKRHIDGSFALVFALFQIIEYFIKIETLKMEILIDCEGGHGCS
jgi:phage terminase large subunit-like protein